MACNEKDECLFCDSLNSYFLYTSSCKKLIIENCKIVDLAGNCFLCSDNYFIDPQTQKCVQLNSTNQIENCVFHTAPLQCLHCKKDYYLSGGKCISASAPIPNCLYISLSNLSLCDSCDKGYLLNYDQKSCFKITERDNCGSYS